MNGAASVGTVITNPLFQHAETFLRLGRKVIRHKVAIVTRTAFIGGIGRRDGLFADAPLARVWGSSKLMSMPPGGVVAEAKDGSVAFAWFVFEHGWRGRPQIKWL